MRWTPVSALISVDLPAPFSPSRAWTSPGNSRNDTSSRASTPGNDTVMPRISTVGGPRRRRTDRSSLVWVSIVGEVRDSSERLGRVP